MLVKSDVTYCFMKFAGAFPHGNQNHHVLIRHGNKTLLSKRAISSVEKLVL